MKPEIEVKFLNINHDTIREQLAALGATCEQPMRLMRRVVIHTPAMTDKNAFVRIRDEGHRTTITYKQFDADSIDGAKEIETTVGSFDDAIQLLDAAGLPYDSFQETRRENWRLGDIEIMLDQWPWIPTYVEIEGPSETAIAGLTSRLGLDWSDAVFGDVTAAYLAHYPHIGEPGRGQINLNWPVIKFSDPAPALLTTVTLP